MTFNPSEQRDEAGKWTTSGGGFGAHPEGPYMEVSKPENAEKAHNVAQVAARVAKKMGFDPTQIHISDESKTFELNGKTLYYAGWATRPETPSMVVDPDGSKQIRGGGTGTVTLFTSHLSDSNIEGVTAHEIAHQQYNALLSDKEIDYIKMREDPAYGKDNQWVTYDPSNPAHEAMRENGATVTTPQADGTRQIREPGFMRSDGTLNEPYASKYPAYQAYTKAMMPMIADFAKSDGVSNYSKEYWLGWKTPTEVSYVNDKGEEKKYTTSLIPVENAFHETLAEIARLKYTKEDIYQRKLGEVDGKPVYFATGKKGLKPEWSKLYRTMIENWKRRSE